MKTRHGNVITLVPNGDDNIYGDCTDVRNDRLLIFAQIVDGGVGELHGESSQSSVCHLLEE